MEMSDQQPNYKRSHESKNEPKQKHQKQNEREGEPVNTTEPEPITLTNIYYDCLERIFDFLDLESLLNVAGTCKRLQIAAAAKFRDDFGGKTIKLNPFYYRYIRIIKYDDQLDFYGLKMCLPFLRCFGATILNLSVSYSGENVHLDNYINRYCADNLKKISFVDKISSKNFSKPFKNVEKIKFFSVMTKCELKNQLLSIVHLFPNMRELEMDSVSIGVAAISVSFPHLKHLRLFVDENSKNDFLQANPQLQSISLFCDVEMSMDKLLDLISENPSISKLKICGDFVAVTTADVNRLINEHPSIEFLICPSPLFTANHVITLIQQLNTLKNFEMCFWDESQSDLLLNELDQMAEEWKYEHICDEDSDYCEIKLTRKK